MSPCHFFFCGSCHLNKRNVTFRPTQRYFSSNVTLLMFYFHVNKMVFSQEKSGKITFFQHYIAHFLHFSNFSEMVLWGKRGEAVLQATAVLHFRHRKKTSFQDFFCRFGGEKQELFRCFRVLNRELFHRFGVLNRELFRFSCFLPVCVEQKRGEKFAG